MSRQILKLFLTVHTTCCIVLYSLKKSASVGCCSAEDTGCQLNTLKCARKHAISIINKTMLLMLNDLVKLNI